MKSPDNNRVVAVFVHLFPTLGYSAHAGSLAEAVTQQAARQVQML